MVMSQNPIDMIPDVEEMIRYAEDKRRQRPPTCPLVTYRLHAASLWDALTLAWRVVWTGEVTISIIQPEDSNGESRKGVR
jgi:hypothetical protein